MMPGVEAERPRHTGPRGSQWTPERDDRLRALWAEGLATAQIALRMGDGLTKSAVVGRAHRLGLPSRPSPIKRAVYGAPKKSAVRKAASPVPASGGSRASGQRHLMSQLETSRKGRREGVSSLNSAPVVASNGGAGVLFGELRPEHCRWPLWGEDRPTEFSYCGHPKAEGRPYCAGHAARAFLPPKPIGPSAVKPDWNAAIGGGKAFEK